MNAQSSLIQMEDIRKVFYADEVETHALAGIHLTIEKGEYVSISGPSGCGKSTLLSLLGLLDTPTDGGYQLDSIPVEDIGAGERARIRNREIGFIIQAFNLIGDLTVVENVELHEGWLTLEQRRDGVTGACAQMWLPRTRLNRGEAMEL
jgi:putative ABC transport system ATP-binding protein